MPAVEPGRAIGLSDKFAPRGERAKGFCAATTGGRVGKSGRRRLSLTLQFAHDALQFRKQTFEFHA